MKILRLPIPLIAFVLSLAAQGAGAAPVIAQINHIDSLPIGNVLAISSAVIVDADTQAPLAGIPFRFSTDTSCASAGAGGTAEGFTDADGFAWMVVSAVAPSLACATTLEVDGVPPLSLPVHTFWPQDVVVTVDVPAIVTVVGQPFTVTARTTESGLPVNAWPGEFSVTSSNNGSSATTQCCLQWVHNSGVYTMPFVANDKQGHYTITVTFSSAPPASVEVKQRLKP
jgi:hypothetical protein